MQDKNKGTNRVQITNGKIKHSLFPVSFEWLVSLMDKDNGGQLNEFLLILINYI